VLAGPFVFGILWAMLTPQQFVLGDTTYTLTPLPSVKGLEVFGQLLQFAGPSLAGVVESTENLADMKTEDLSRGLRDLCTRALGADLLHFWAIFAEQTTVKFGDQSKKLSVASVSDALFTGKVQDMLVLLKAHLELNYSGFFAFVGSMLPASPAGKLPTA
jgi:hypothetical protein